MGVANRGLIYGWLARASGEKALCGLLAPEFAGRGSDKLAIFSIKTFCRQGLSSTHFQQ